MIRPTLALLAASAALVATAPAAAAVSLVQEADGYRVTLGIAPAKPFVAATAGAGAGAEAMVRIAGADPVPHDAPSRPTHHLSLSVADAKTGKPVTDADIGLFATRFDGKGAMLGELKTVPVVTMRTAGGGLDTTHYGNNVRLEPGRYRIMATVKGMGLVFFPEI